MHGPSTTRRSQTWFCTSATRAEYDESLTNAVDAASRTVESGLLHYLDNEGLTRVLSLRYESPTAYHRLITSPLGTEVDVDIDERHLPLLVAGRKLTVLSSQLILAVVDRSLNVDDDIALAIDDNPVIGFSTPTDPFDPDKAFGGLPAKTLGTSFGSTWPAARTLRIDDAGELAPGVATEDAAIDEWFASWVRPCVLRRGSWNDEVDELCDWYGYQPEVVPKCTAFWQRRDTLGSSHVRQWGAFVPASEEISWPPPGRFSFSADGRTDRCLRSGKHEFARPGDASAAK